MPLARRPRPRTYRPRKKTVTRKRMYRKTRTFRPQRLLTVGFPKTNMVKLRYVDTVSIDPGAGTITSHAFRANSCFDPDFTGAGHQPMNFDMWSSLYNHYIVVGSKCSARFYATVGTSLGVVTGITLSDDTTFTTDCGAMMEQGLSKYRIAYENPVANKGNGAYVTKGFSCKKFFNITNPTDNITRLGASVSANPSELAFFIIFAGGLPSTIDNPGVYKVNVIIDYIVIFSEPKDQPQS